MDRTQRIADLYCARALELNQADLETLRQRALRNLARMREQGSASSALLARWSEVAQRPESFRWVLSASAAEAAELRRNHPLAGALPEAERQEIVRRTRDEPAST
ncbi:hypothetical protein CKO28_24825 [Rhodovibrio sodomensis]|uniref:Uncharacterized protein n=1 Tax=Rhodovibrio sodomensis TaxID=1088 RepID=A0ABS1DL19_9PROT|nr:hypothetical protein [Rhodovibrio sodomensis]MBK1671230.1 hypothetical protein [Rhodovibrio sodomensis]